MQGGAGWVAGRAAGVPAKPAQPFSTIARKQPKEGGGGGWPLQALRCPAHHAGRLCHSRATAAPQQAPVRGAPITLHNPARRLRAVAAAAAQLSRLQPQLVPRRAAKQSAAQLPAATDSDQRGSINAAQLPHVPPTCCHTNRNSQQAGTGVPKHSCTPNQQELATQARQEGWEGGGEWRASRPGRQPLALGHGSRPT